MSKRASSSLGSVETAVSSMSKRPRRGGTIAHVVALDNDQMVQTQVPATAVDESQYHQMYWKVEKILDCRENKETGVFEFLIRWENWDGDDSWEPQSNLDDAGWNTAECFRLHYMEQKAKRHCVFCHQRYDIRVPFGCAMPHRWITVGGSGDQASLSAYFCVQCGKTTASLENHQDPLANVCRQLACHADQVEDRWRGEARWPSLRCGPQCIGAGCKAYTHVSLQAFEGCGDCLYHAKRHVMGLNAN